MKKKEIKLSPLQLAFFVWMFMSNLVIILFLITSIINLGYPELMMLHEPISLDMFTIRNLITSLCVLGFCFGLTLIIIERLGKILIVYGENF